MVRSRDILDAGIRVLAQRARDRKEKGMEVTINTKVLETGVIEQDLVRNAFVSREAETPEQVIYRSILDTREQQVQQALIGLGWKPPTVPVQCPWCGQGDFDLIGLKHHLVRGWCEVYERTEVPR